MFGDDFFGGGIEDIFNKLAGGSFSQGASANRGGNLLLSVVGNNKSKYFIFDLSGKVFESVSIKDDLEVNGYGEEVATGDKVLEIAIEGGRVLKYSLPRELRKRSLRHTFVNGILEVTLEK